MSVTLVIKQTSELKDPEATSGDVMYLVSSQVNVENVLSRFQDNSFDKLYVVETTLSENVQEQLYRVVKPNGKFMVDGINSREEGQQLSVDLKIVGFLDIMAAKDPSSGRRFIVAQKPNWETGAIAKLPATAPTKVEEKKEEKSWKVSITDIAEEELIDENALLEEAGPVPVDANAGGCAPDSNGKKRACKNCSCGLAEEEAKASSTVTLSAEEKVVKASSCGSCYKGDAFRCGSCPFLGKPAFEPGMEKVILAMGDDDF